MHTRVMAAVCSATERTRLLGDWQRTPAPSGAMHIYRWWWLDQAGSVCVEGVLQNCTTLETGLDRIPLGPHTACSGVACARLLLLPLLPAAQKKK